MRRTAFYTLRHYGYEILQAENGKQALDLLINPAVMVSLVLLDMTMPVMSGEETLRGIRRLRPDLPVVLTSGFSEPEAMKRFGASGLAGFLQKPFASPVLAKAVKEALAKTDSPGKSPAPSQT